MPKSRVCLNCRNESPAPGPCSCGERPEGFDPDTSGCDDSTARFLSEVGAVVSKKADGRGRYYGDPATNHQATADFWRVYVRRKYGVDLPLTGRDVVWMNILQKTSRDANREKRDNLLDTAGYAENADRMAGGA